MNEHPKYYITYMKFHADAIHDSATVIHKEKMMNERIRQLYYECQDESQSTESCYQKFAELIVRECANVANSGIDPAESHLIGNDILEHFGVEE
jgi:hypothetical protein